MINKINVNSFKEQRYDLSTYDKDLKGYFFNTEENRSYIENEKDNFYMEVKKENGKIKLQNENISPDLLLKLFNSIKSIIN